MMLLDLIIYTLLLLGLLLGLGYIFELMFHGYINMMFGKDEEEEDEVK